MDARNFISESATAVDDVRKRINELLIANGKTIGSVYEDKSAARKVYNQMNGSSLSVETVWQLLRVFPMTSADWLIKGEGGMYLTPKSQSINDTVTIGNGNSVGNSSVTVNKSADDKLKEENIALKIQVTKLEGEVALYKQKAEIYYDLYQKQNS